MLRRSPRPPNTQPHVLPHPGHQTHPSYDARSHESQLPQRGALFTPGRDRWHALRCIEPLFEYAVAMPHSDASDLQAEVVAVNQLLATWFGTDADPEILERVAATQAETFSMVSLDGVRVSQSDLLAELRRNRNSRPGLKIEISDFEVLLAEGDVRVVRCLERHHLDGKRSDRWTTAVLTTQSTPPRFRWQALHESPVD